jgi:tetratricopeptide (TPR) repeat protein
MESLEYIDSYFKGELAPEETRQFEIKVESDPLFAEEVAFYVSAMSLAKQEADEEKKQRFRTLYEQQEKPVAKVVPMRKWYTYAAAAAVLAVFFIGYFLFQRSPNPDQLAENYITKNLATLSVKMGTSADSLQKGLGLYNEGKFQEAKTIFQAIAAADPNNSEAIKYAGITALQLKHYDDAISYFSKLEQFTLYSNPGKFYHAIALMKRNHAGDKDQAKLLLQEVVKNDLEGRDVAEKWLRDL